MQGTAALEQVQRMEPVATRAYRELRRALLQRAFVPGQRLVEVELAQQLGVSRTPVREALRRLVAEGLVEMLPSGGMAVRDTRSEMADIYGLRQVLEGYAARLAATRITPEEIDHLESFCLRMRDALATNAHEQTVELNTAFHLAIAAASHSARLIEMIEGYRDLFLTPRTLSRYDHAAMLHSQQQHEAMVGALRRRDGATAEQVVREHFGDAVAIMLDHPPPAEP
jgi:DNA-binding GntR family transcriptional regulator